MTGCTVRILREKSLVSLEDTLVSLESLLVVFINLRCCQMCLLSKLTYPIDLVAHDSLVKVCLSFTRIQDIVIGGLDSHH